MKRLAVFFVYVWPEPRSSAAGVRTRELLEILLADGWSCAAVSPSGASPHRDALEALGVRTYTADPNDSAAAEAALSAAGEAQLALFDRFVMEEQFGWRARARWPQAFQVVDTQDLHSLRRARERLALAGAPRERVLRPSGEEMGEDLSRELASLYRADSALVVSSFERDLLTGTLGFPAENLRCLPFSTEILPAAPGFRERAGFCFLGNFRHPPNLDSVRTTLRDHWPAVRARLPHAELHLYGAYPPAEISAHRGAHGVFAHGPVEDHRSALARHRALLAPLRFGAGIKGKVLEAWSCATPVVGTTLTFEGIGGGVVAQESAEIAAACARLEEDEAFWNTASRNGAEAVRQNFLRARVAADFLAFLREGLSSLAQRRERNLVGRMLRHQSLNATKYFSRWIEAKNR